MKVKGVLQTTIIGGESGPTAVFIAGRGEDLKMPLKDCIRKKKRLLMQKKNTIFCR